jgi:hypothetical protein
VEFANAVEVRRRPERSDLAVPILDSVAEAEGLEALEGRVAILTDTVGRLQEARG